MSSDKTILLISHVYPYPIHDGGRMDVFYRIKSLYELGYNVILIAFYNPALPLPDETVLSKYCISVLPIPYLRRKLSKIFTLKPYSVASKEDWESIDEVLNCIMKKGVKIDSIIAESFHTFTIAERASQKLGVSKVYIRSHNNEPRFMKSVALSSKFYSIKRFFYFFESLKFELYMPKIMEKMGKSFSIWHISPDELGTLQRKFPSIDQQFLPAGIDLSGLKKREIFSKKNVLFAGALFSPNNIHGLNWYLREIHPVLLSREKNYQLLVAGNTQGANPSDIQHLINHERVVLFDTPDNMDPIYSSARVFINPMLLGAGVKLKTLDAALQGLPVVTTTIGNEGTGLTSGSEVLVGDTSEIFTNHVIDLLFSNTKCSVLVENAQRYMIEKFNQKHELSKLLS